jgi:hypothetical protein
MNLNKQLLDEIKSTLIISGDYIIHDPVDPDIIYDFVKGIWNAPKRTTMPFYKKRCVDYTVYNHLFDIYNLYHTEITPSYYRPIDFYDHVLNNDEISKLENDDLVKYIVYFIRNKRLLEANTMIEYSINKFTTKVSYFKILQKNIIKDWYRLIESPLNNNELNIVDETWNTNKYYTLLPPRKNKGFVNIKTCNCKCQTFRTRGNCEHSLKILIYKVLTTKYKNIIIVRDIYENLKQFI